MFHNADDGHLVSVSQAVNGFESGVIHVTMWEMLQRDTPEDYVIATGLSHSVRDLVEAAFSHVGLDWQNHVRTSSALLRPTEVEHLIGDASKARSDFGWQPSIDFLGLIQMMVDADLERVNSSKTTV